MVALLTGLCGVVSALFGVLKAYLEYAATKAKTKVSENGASDKSKPRF